MILNIPVDREEDGSNNNIINLKISFNLFCHFLENHGQAKL